MDDRVPSPPTSSKKSSVLSKADLTDTPRSSPYRTRSRKNSNLTEENIAVHNDTPTTRAASRRVTRRMSQDLQGTENAITLTPVLAATKRSRRSPSVASDDAGVVTKPKFTLAQENVVMEEDELLDETKSQSQSVKENGASNLNKKDTIEVTAVVSSDNNVAASKVSNNSSQKIDPKADQTESVTVAKIDDVIEPSKSNGMESGSATQINFTEIEMFSDTDDKESAKTTVASESNALVSQPIDLINTNSSQGVETPKLVISSTAPEEPKINTEVYKAESVPNSGQSPKSNLTDSVTGTASATVSNLANSMSLVVDKTVESPVPVQSDKVTPKTPLNPVPKTQPGTASKPKSALIITEVICLDTPLKPSVKEIQTTSQVAPVEKQDSMDVTESCNGLNVNNAMTVPVDMDVKEKTPSETVPVDMDVTVINKETPKIAETPSKSMPVDMDVSILNEVIAIAETPSKTMPVDMDVSILNKVTESPSKTVAVDMDLSTLNEEPSSTKAADIPPETTPIDMEVSIINNESAATIAETPSESKPVDMEVSILPNETLANSTSTNDTVDMNVTVINRGSPIKSTITSTKSVTVELKNASDVAHQTTQSKTDPFAELESNTAPNTLPLENGTSTVVQQYVTTSKVVKQYATFGYSVHRKSDGKPIDSFGISERVVEKSTLPVRKSAASRSIISIKDTSDEDDDEDDASVRNEFLDDEAIESNGESSMDEEERRYLEENEIPSDGISLGSDTDVENSNDESDDSFVVSDASVALLDGSGDDLEIDNEKSTMNTSKGKPMRGNKIIDTSEDELVMKSLEEKPKKVNLKRRSDEMIPRSLQATKRLSLHPNLKLNSDELEMETVEQRKNKIDDSSEEDVAKELANLDAEPKKRKGSKRLSETQPLSKKDNKRMSLHPNTKLNSGDLIEEENNSTIDVKDSNSEDGSKEKELANLDAKPETTSMEDGKVDNSLETFSIDSSTIDGIVEEGMGATSKSLPTKDQTIIDVSDDVAEEMANLDALPKKTTVSKRLSESMSHSKKDMKRMSLHPDAKLNCDELEYNKNQKKPKLELDNRKPSALSNTLPNGIEEMDIEPSTSKSISVPSTSTGQHKGGELSREEIQAKCDAILNSAMEAKREEKLKAKAELQEEKYLKLKEKKLKKLQEKKKKEARQLEREVLAAQQRQHKREKKLKPKEMTEEEKSKAIEKALAFSEKIKSEKIKHSVKQEMSNESNESKDNTAAAKTNRKRKRLAILDDQPISKKTKKPSEPTQLPAKPEGFEIHSRPIQKPKNLKLRKDKRKSILSVEKTTAGAFEVRNVPKKASPFIVTTLDCNPPFKFSNFKDEAILSSNVKRESAAELLARKQRQNTL